VIGFRVTKGGMVGSGGEGDRLCERRRGLLIWASSPPRTDIGSASETEEESESDIDDCSEITSSAGAVGMAAGEAVTRGTFCE
jgi:hypothetical protein